MTYTNKGLDVAMPYLWDSAKRGSTYTILSARDRKIGSLGSQVVMMLPYTSAKRIEQLKGLKT
jgi:hypothetical protein